jgi:LysR family glycine cleavage system transcriptional activator
MSDLPPIRGLIAFEAIAHHGSFGKAAEELNLTSSAVSHQVANLEDYVGCPLFVRTSHGATLTPAGERFQRNLAGALGLIASAAESARQEEGDVLRIHSAPSFAALWLLPRLKDFKEANPGVRIGLSTSHTLPDFMRQEVDLNIRYGAIRSPELHVEPLFPDEIAPMASPKTMQRLQSRISRVEDLLSQDLILSEGALVQWPQWFDAHGIRVSPAHYVLSFDRSYMVLHAVAQGLGIALESAILAESMLQAGELVRIFPNEKGILLYAYYLVYPQGHSTRQSVARFVAWLHKQVASHRHM